jgi:hypothetical protein
MCAVNIERTKQSHVRCEHRTHQTITCAQSSVFLCFHFAAADDQQPFKPLTRTIVSPDLDSRLTLPALRCAGTTAHLTLPALRWHHCTPGMERFRRFTLLWEVSGSQLVCALSSSECTTTWS